MSHNKWEDFIRLKKHGVRHDHTSVLQVMDLLLNELCLNLDEDMKDFDEYELSLSDYLHSNGHYDA